MKGLMYNSFIQMKNSYIAVAVTWLVFMITGALLHAFSKESLFIYPILDAMTIFLPMFCTVIATNGNPRKTESMLKCGFTKYTLTSGVTHKVFVITELAEMLINIILGFGVSAAGLSIYKLMGIHVEMVFSVRFAIVFSLAAVILQFTANAVTFFLKNAEVAILCVFFACGILFAIFFSDNILSGENTVIVLDNKLVGICAAVTAAVLMIDSAVIYLKLKKDIR